jgi:hypothetical protein
MQTYQYWLGGTEMGLMFGTSLQNTVETRQIRAMQMVATAGEWVILKLSWVL